MKLKQISRMAICAIAVLLSFSDRAAAVVTYTIVPDLWNNRTEVINGVTVTVSGSVGEGGTCSSEYNSGYLAGTGNYVTLSFSPAVSSAKFAVLFSDGPSGLCSFKVNGSPYSLTSADVVTPSPYCFSLGTAEIVSGNLFGGSSYGLAYVTFNGTISSVTMTNLAYVNIHFGAHFGAAATCTPPTIAAGGGSTICAGQSTELTATGGSTYSWAPSTGLSGTSGASVTATPTVTTTYTVTGGTGTCTNTATVTVSVNSIPANTIAAGGLVRYGTITTIAGSGGTPAYTGDGGPATNAPLYNPYAVTIDPSGNMYLVEDGNRVVRKVTPSGTISTFAGAGGNLYGNNIPATSASMGQVYGLAADAAGNIYIAEGIMGRVRKISTSGIISTIGGNGSQVYSGDGGQATAAGMFPYGLAVDATGNVYVADQNNNRVRKISTSGIVTTIGGTGGSGFSGDGGPATNAEIKSPSGIHLDAAGNMYVSCGTGARVRKIDASGIITSVAGVGSFVNSEDGIPATSAGLVYPSHTVTDNYGNVYIHEQYRIRKINSAGIISTITGSSYGFSGDGGPALAARYGYILDMAIDASGNLWVVDYGNNRVRKFAITNNAELCKGSSSLQLANSIASGAWSSSNANASVSSAGVITGDNAGTVTITYTAPGGCYATTTTTVNALPTVSISGSTDAICPGASAYLTTSGAPMYSWSPSASTSCAVCDYAFLTPTVTTTYTVTGTDLVGCTNTATRIVSVNPIAISVSSNTTICEGASSALTAGGGSGTYTWLPSSGLSATIGTAIMASPTVTTTYTVTRTSGSCTNTATVTVSVNPSPSTIMGATQLCMGVSTALSSDPTGGSWSSSNENATVSSTGDVTGANAGPVVITYTLSSGCYKTKLLVVNALPVVNAGMGASVCNGSSVTLSGSGAPSYVWSPAAGLSSSTGASVTASPSLTTTYTLTGTDGNGCSNTATTTVAVNSTFPIAVTPSKSICLGSPEALTATGSATSYVWSPAATLSASTGASVIATPTVTTTYTVAGTQGACTQIRTVTLTVNAVPNAITGTFQWCKGQASTLGCTPGGGTWSSSATGIVSIGNSSGIATGVNGGTATIAYTKSGCSSVKEVTVVATPAITGLSTICTGLTTTMGNTITGGTWFSSVDTIASIDITTGELSALHEGVTTITYTPSGGCAVTKQFTVGLPPAIEGLPYACLGQTVDLDHPISGGTWSSSNPARATVDEVSGVVYGVTLGNFYITYTLGSGCQRIMEMAVQTFPLGISGSLSICEGVTTTLTNETISGTWSSSAPLVADISTLTGAVIGYTTGTTNITYTFHQCYHTEVLTVNAYPSDITGPDEICEGSSITYASLPVGGTWLSSAPTKATIGSMSGSATGVSAGTTNITYTAPLTGCRKTKSIVVKAQPGTLSGTTTLCAGSTTTITSASGAGTWSSVNMTAATVGTTLSLSTVVTGLATGTTTVTTTNDLGCSRSIVVSVNEAIGAITGDDIVCAGNTLPLGTTGTGGTWSSSATAKATVGSTGVVLGVAAGTATISYKTNSTCYAMKQVTVNGTPGTISGSNKVCIGSPVTLGHTETGGTWVSSTPARATVDEVSGVVTGIATGAVTITYNINTGCFKTLAMTVNPAPAAIGGGSTVCQGTNITLTNGTTGGTWSSSNASVASVPSSPGTVTGMGSGVATITYKLTATGCIATRDVTVNEQPLAITGATQVCIGNTEMYNTLSTGGTWTSSMPARATIDAVSGQAGGVSAGAVTLTYSNSTGCFKTYGITVNAPPAAIFGTARVCELATTQLTDATAGGTWSSSSTSTATVSIAGLVTGVNDGAATITYKVTATGCIATRDVIVDSLPTAIIGANQICIGSTEMYSSMPSGGAWVSSAIAKATIGNATGTATGVAVGTTLLSYTVPVTGCRITKSIVVNAVPLAITGINVVCVGNAVTLTCSTAGQTWSSTMEAATVSSLTATTALLTGMSAGITTISYTNAAGCASKLAVTVNDAVPAITGDLVVCPTRTIQLGNTATPGTWSSALTTRATVNTTGLVTGVNAGAVNISFKQSAGCYKVAAVTVSAAPAAITPASPSVCVGDSVDLNHVTPGGTWGSSNANALANVATGFVTGSTAGTSTITYSINSGCFVTAAVTVKASPASIGGSLAVAVGSTSLLTNTTTGGTWSSSTPGIGTIGSTSGLMGGVASGSTTITYKVTSTGCYVTGDATVSGGAARHAGTEMGGQQKHILIYPNPTHGLITVEASVEGTFTVYTLDGKTVQQYHTEAPSTGVSLPNNLAAGVYMCRFEGADGSTQLVRIVYAP